MVKQAKPKKKKCPEKEITRLRRNFREASSMNREKLIKPLNVSEKEIILVG